MTFMVDTRAEHSVVTTPVAPLIGQIATIVGAIGDLTALSFCKDGLCQQGGHLVTHEFLYFLECPIPLLGRDLRQEWGHKSPLPPESWEPHLGEPIGFDDGCAHAQGR